MKKSLCYGWTSGVLVGTLVPEFFFFFPNECVPQSGETAKKKKMISFSLFGRDGFNWKTF